MKLSFVIPTYNEAGNIGKLISRIKSACKFPYEIIVVDDNSPDNTALIAKKAGAKVILRKDRKGLGSAYKEGFKHVKGDVIFMMDADLSHDPADIPRFIKALKGYDVVQGSRKIKGGEIEEWSPFRYAISYLSSLITLPLTGIKDPNGSYKCFKKEILNEISLKNTSDGFGFLIEFMYLLKKHNKKIKEIPIKFNKRLSGKSKLTLKEILRSFRLYLILYKRLLLK